MWGVLGAHVDMLCRPLKPLRGEAAFNGSPIAMISWHRRLLSTVKCLVACFVSQLLCLSNAIAATPRHGCRSHPTTYHFKYRTTPTETTVELSHRQFTKREELQWYGALRTLQVLRTRYTALIFRPWHHPALNRVHFLSVGSLTIPHLGCRFQHFTFLLE